MPLGLCRRCRQRAPRARPRLHARASARFRHAGGGEGAAWCFVKVEEHIDELVAAWREAGSAEAAGGCSPFTRQIESFIGTVLMRACVSAMGDAELRDEVRELLVLEREQVYERILARIEERLAEIASA
jgi:hypothetical protein